MKYYLRLGLPALLLAVSLILASCGGAGGAMKGMDHGQGKKGGGSMKGMKMDETTGGMAGMNHGGMKGMASGMLMKNGKYSDERFIDAMAPHHAGAVDMARVALKNADHPQIKQLATNIVSSQEAEIKEMRSIKEKMFGTSNVPTKMSPKETKDMGMMMDPGKLADQKPFDKAFIDAMIPHHESAVEMAQVARQKTENPKIKQLATNIVGDQQKEIAQMKAWRKEWYPKG